MRKLAPLFSAGLLLAVVSQAMADSPKPRAILSLSSYDRVKIATDDVAFIKDAPEMPTWLSSFVELYSKGRDVAGLSHNRPWGAVIQGTDELSGYAFVPVSTLSQLEYELSSYIRSTSDLGGGFYKLVGTEAGKQIYVRELNGWLYVSDCTEVLASVCTNPATLIDGLDRTYDVAVRLLLRNVPAREGQCIIEELDKALGATLRKNTSEKTVDLLGQAAFELDEVTLGWSKR